MVMPIPETLGRYLKALDELNPHAYDSVADFALRVYSNAARDKTDIARKNGWHLEGHKIYCVAEHMRQIFLRHLFQYSSDGPHDLRFVVADSKAYAVLYCMIPNKNVSSNSVFFEPKVSDICELFGEFLYIYEAPETVSNDEVIKE
jgi:hypothetical protein